MKPEELKVLGDPAKLSLPLQALWHDARGDWERAHEVCQQAKSCEGDWVHAYLHRKEGDSGNAGYWYARAGRTMPDARVDLEGEWAEIVSMLA
ncbi:MAG: hypothetical protein H7Y06_02740 [Opitutaceae bacterium]|nr:hypothetical protein [Opitutaceae bacterium]